jgi:hypothetical protein
VRNTYDTPCSRYTGTSARGQSPAAERERRAIEAPALRRVEVASTGPGVAGMAVRMVRAALLIVLFVAQSACRGRVPPVVEGTARSAKAGAVIVRSDGTPVYVLGVSRWPADLEGRQVGASGELRQRKLLDDPRTDAGELRQGGEGQSWVLENAQVEPLSR